MPWRKLLVRGLVYSVMGGGVLAFLLYHFWTNPAAVRRQVLDKLAERFPGAIVTLDAAQVRLFGGIGLGELRMARRDDLDKTDFLYVPSAVLYHDKERLNEGVVTFRKIELFQPRLRLVRDREGRINLDGVTAPAAPTRETLPTIVVQQGTLVLEDHTAAPGTPLLEIKDVNLTAINDPPTIISIDGTGRTDVLGPVHIHASVRRDSGEASGELELSAVPFGPALVQRLAVVCPETAANLRGFRADGEVKATFSYRPGSSGLTFDGTVKAHKGELTHARLPLTLEDLEAEVRLASPTARPAASKNAAAPIPCTCVELLYVPTAHLTARSGKMRFELSLKDLDVQLPMPVASDGEMHPERWARELDWKVEHLPVSKKLLDYFPPLKEIQHDYSPEGLATVTHAFRRDGAGGWHKTFHVVPEGMSGSFHNFPYLVENITGFIDYEKSSGHSQKCRLELAGTTEGHPILVTGTSRMEGESENTGEVDIQIVGDNIPLDEKLGKALVGPGKTAHSQFHPEGLGDFRVRIFRPLGATRFANRCMINVHDAAFNYDLFPLHVDHVSGVLDLLPDHWEARNFRGVHGAGELTFSGRSFPEGQPGPRMRVEIHGTAIPLDKQFEEALAPRDIKERAALKTVWQTLALADRMSFNAEVTDLGGEPANLDVKVDARGCSMRPKFFEFELTDVGGSAHYTRDRVTISDITAHHGAATLRIQSGLILPKPGGTFQTRLGTPDRPGSGIVITGLNADADLRHALPEKFHNALDGVNLKGPFDLAAVLIVDPEEDGKNNTIWWDGKMIVHNASLQAGVDLTGIEGEAACWGLYKNQKLHSVGGGILFSDSSILGQPLHNMHTNFVVTANAPDFLRFYNVGAEFFGGQIGGEAHIDMTTPSVPRFEVNLTGKHMMLEQFGRFNAMGSGAELQGVAEMSLFLKGKVDDISSLTGNGGLEVPDGKLYRLPPILQLLKVLGLGASDRTAFERAKLEFNVEGQRVNITALNLLGTFVSLRGQGTVKIDGSDLIVDVNADPGMFPQAMPILGSVEKSLSDQVLRIKVRGSLTEPRFEKELMPGVLDPVRRLMGTGN